MGEAEGVGLPEDTGVTLGTTTDSGDADGLASGLPKGLGLTEGVGVGEGTSFSNWSPFTQTSLPSDFVRQISFV